MILLRKNAFSETSIEIPFVKDESALTLIKRTVTSNGYEESEAILNHFQILINGLAVEKDLWEVVTIKETDQVLIAPKIQGGEGGQIFKQIAIITIVVIAAAYGQGQVSAGVWSAYGAAAFSASVAIGSTLLLNSLIPPLALGLPDLGNLESAADSQMYTIGSQSNQVKKYGYVPKVYGEHRMFPFIAANPYTELFPDSNNDRELVQYFYGIYDFGLGPLTVRDIKIGETPISNFTEVDYSFVDFNRPSEELIGAEESWDEILDNELNYYKGDVSREDVSYALNENKYLEQDPLVITINPNDYQVIRSVPLNIPNAKSEIILDFVCQDGLISYSTNGNTYDRSIELQVEFRQVGTVNWIGFNDLSAVKTFKTLGKLSNLYRDVRHNLPDKSFSSAYDLITNWTSWENIGNSTYTYDTTTRKYYFTKTYGLKKGRTELNISNSSPATVGRYIYLGNEKLGKIIVWSGTTIFPGTKLITLEKPLTKSYELFTVTYVKDDPTGPVVETRYSDGGRILTTKVISLGGLVISDKVSTPKYFSIRFQPLTKADLEVRVTRLRSSSTANYSIRDNLTFLAVTRRSNKNPIDTKKRHVFLDLKILATNQLNGTIQDLNGLVTSILPVYDSLTQTWTNQPTNNPAWVFCDLLTGDVNQYKIPKSRLHMESIVEWANYCDEVPEDTPTKMYYDKRFTCNFVLDFNTTLQQLLNSVCNAAQASLNIIDGKYGVLIDKYKSVPVQIFTPRNSWNFSSVRNYSDSPQALKIRFVSPTKGWGVEETIVYNEGYNAINTTEFQELSAFACTSPEQAYRYGKYMLLQSRLRQETISIDLDFEHIVCTRGDYVQITQDIMKVGGSPARVKSVVGNVVRIDDGIETTAIPYGYTFRGVSGIETNTLTVISSDEFQLDGPLPSVGDLIIIGPVGTITYDCLVKSIVPNSDLTASITLVEKADAIYDYETIDDFPDYSPQLNLNQDPSQFAPPAVEELEITDNTWRVVGGEYRYYIGVDWTIDYGVAFEIFEIYVDNGTGYNLVDFTKMSDYEYIVDQNYLGIEHSFKILGVSANGKKISLLDAPSVTATPLRKTSPPSNIDALYINITNQVLQLEWPRITDSDLKEYLLRYSPNPDASWEASIPITNISGATNSTSIQGRTGSYFIKAIDLNGNQSVVAAKAITSIPNLFDLNIIEETNDFPLLPGELVQTEFIAESVILQQLDGGSSLSSEYYPEGYYYYENLLDLGEIYTVRLQSLVEAEGYTIDDLMGNWVLLSEVNYMSNAGQASWDVETQFRGTDQILVMANWPILSLVNPISEGVQDNWTDWRKFIVGDFTARIFQFRLRLISKVANVSPRVFDGIIKADMPDRFETYNNTISSISGTSITYDPPFKGPGTTPNIQITQDDAETGDYFVISNKTLNGFDIIFYDLNNNPVARQFDVAVKGYGRKAEAVI